MVVNTLQDVSSMEAEEAEGLQITGLLTLNFNNPCIQECNWRESPIGLYLFARLK